MVLTPKIHTHVPLSPVFPSYFLQLPDQPEKLALMPKPVAEFSHPLSPAQTCQASGKFAEWIVVVFQREAYVTSKIRSFIWWVALSLWWGPQSE